MPDQWLVRFIARLFYARYGRTLRDEARKWEQLADEGRRAQLITRLGSRGKDITLRPNVEILAPNRVHLGDHVAIGHGSIIRGQGGITLEDFVLIGDYVILATTEHPIGERYLSNSYHKPIHIKQNVWLAANVVVLPGVTIGENSAIGAGAVVVNDIPPNSVAVGAPAKVIKTFDNSEQIAAQKAKLRQIRDHWQTEPQLY